MKLHHIAKDAYVKLGYNTYAYNDLRRLFEIKNTLNGYRLYTKPEVRLLLKYGDVEKDEPFSIGMAGIGSSDISIRQYAWRLTEKGKRICDLVEMLHEMGCMSGEDELVEEN